MLESGYIKLYRSLLTWEWYQDANTLRLFLHLILTANHFERKWRGITVKRGQRVCSYADLSGELGLSLQGVRTAVKHLKSTGELTHETTSQYSLFTVVNYDKYQEATPEATPGQQAANSQLTHDQQQSKKDKKVRKQEIYTGDIPAPEKKTYGEFGKVQLTDEQYEGLVQRLGKDLALSYIESLDGYMASNGKRYKDHYATVLNWWRKDRRTGSQPRPQKQNKSAQTGNQSSIDMEKIHRMLHGGGK